MPYIHRIHRGGFASERVPNTPGELNYAITQLLIKYVLGRGDVRYQNCNDAIGALECAKLEFYRRLVAPYEDAKMLENGDVYPTGDSANV